MDRLTVHHVKYHGIKAIVLTTAVLLIFNVCLTSPRAMQLLTVNKVVKSLLFKLSILYIYKQNFSIGRYLYGRIRANQYFPTDCYSQITLKPIYLGEPGIYLLSILALMSCSDDERVCAKSMDRIEIDLNDNTNPNLLPVTSVNINTIVYRERWVPLSIEIDADYFYNYTISDVNYSVSLLFKR